MPKVFAIVPAAGQGTRMGDALPKQYLPILGKPMMFHSIEALAAVPRITCVCVVLSPLDRHWGEHDWSHFSDKIEPVFVGGASRAQSVMNALVHLESRTARDDWVLVHDAARCLVTPAQINALLDACENDPVGGLLALKLPDTLKTEAGGRVAATVDRSDKWLAQTPQMFRLGALRDALAAQADSGFAGVTDEASAMELAGHRPLLVPGSAQNFKVTYPEDFALAEAILNNRT